MFTLGKGCRRGAARHTFKQRCARFYGWMLGVARHVSHKSSKIVKYNLDLPHPAVYFLKYGNVRMEQHDRRRVTDNLQTMVAFRRDGQGYMDLGGGSQK